jgi:hypothetical protein
MATVTSIQSSASSRPLRLHCRPVSPLSLLAGLVALGCGGSDLVLPSDGGPANVEIVQGDGQAGRAGSPLADSLVVRLADQAGTGVPGRTVSWIVSAGGGSATPGAVTTDAEGLASAQWTLGQSPGPNTLNAFVSGVGQVTFTAMASGGGGGGGGGSGGGDASTLELIEGNNQSAPAGKRVPIQPAVRVIDAMGEPVAGYDVTFAVTGGGGTVEHAVETTNGDGIARTDWTLGPSPGTNTLEAQAGSLQGSPVVFTAEATSSGGGVDHFVFQVQPHDVRRDERFTVQVAMVDADGAVVPLSGIVVYLGLFQEGSDVPSNGLLVGERFQPSQGGVAGFNLAVTKKGHYRFRVLTDDLPSLGPHGPQPYVFSSSFDVD